MKYTLLYIYILNYQEFPEVVHFRTLKQNSHGMFISWCILQSVVNSLTPYDIYWPFPFPSTLSILWASYIYHPGDRLSGRRQARLRRRCLQWPATLHYKSHRSQWKNVKVKEPCRVWGLNSAALVHYVDRCWQVMAHAAYAWSCMNVEEAKLSKAPLEQFLAVIDS